MAHDTFAALIAPLPILMPLTGAALLAAAGLAGIRPSERAVERLVRFAMLASCLAVLILAWTVASAPETRLHYGEWFTVGEYHFHLELLLDRLSVPLTLAAVSIASLVGYFASRYLHRDEGYRRFFFWYLAFAAGLALALLAGTFSLLVLGWEIVGLSSVFLVAFYGERGGPADASTFVFASYRVADIGLLGATALLPVWIGGDRLFAFGAPAAVGVGGSVAALGAFLLLWAAMGKSAQGPFAAWLPRAMEGPTPSSAIFYGALSVHLGAYLLLRTFPFWHNVTSMRGVVVAIGLLTAGYGAFVGRTRSDIKSFLAFASMAQVGLIFAEIGLGWHRLATVHMLGHAFVRTWQFLRAPSAIADWRRFRRAAGTERPRSTHATPFAAWAYRQALGGLGLEELLRQFVAEPVMRLARELDFGQRERAHRSPVSFDRDVTLPSPAASGRSQEQPEVSRA